MNPSTSNTAPNCPPLGQPLPHESARGHVTGSAPFVDDLPEWQGTLYAAPILSPIAHGRIDAVDAQAALALPGVRGLVLAADVPGDPLLASLAHDEPILPRETVDYAGQVVGLVVADSVALARQAARQVRLQLTPLPAILTVEAALQAQHWVLPPVTLRRGNAEAALAAAPHRLQGQLRSGAQEHFYLEGQVAYALPQEDGQWLVHSSTQHPGEVQAWIASALGLAQHAVRVECRRMGGGFGGKETQAGQTAVWAALAAHKFDRPVKLRLERGDDFRITGKRHPFVCDYTVGFDDQGRIQGLKLQMAADCGFSADLSGPIADRALFHVDNAYHLADVDIVSYRCKTHKQSSTAFRGFGGPQGMLVTESILGDIARALGRDPLDVRRHNLYDPAGHPSGRDTTPYGMQVTDNILEPLIAQLEANCDYRARQADIAAWNARQPVLRRGLALTPVKFGISFTATLLNQAGALVNVYTDGSVLVNHGGTEMGQGLHTKVRQIVAATLGLPPEQVRATASDTSKVPNASATAASSGSDLNGKAAQAAALQVRDRLAALVAEQDGCAPDAVVFADGQVRSPQTSRSFVEVVGLAYAARVPLWSDGFYATPDIHYDPATLQGRPFFYFAYGAACTEVLIDRLTGEHRLLRVDLLHDVGQSLNPAIDTGQIEGGYLQGVGWLTSEELVWDQQGRLATNGPSSYKIPTAGDLPAAFHVALWPEPNRADTVGRSKAVGEPPFMLAISAFEALRNAIAAGRPGDPRTTVALNAPATPEAVFWSLQGAGERPTDAQA